MSTSDSSKSQNVDSLAGTTRKVYRFLLKANGPMRTTDVQRGLSLSTPSLAQYHLKKLEEMGLIHETQEGYVVEGVVVKHAFRLRRRLIPFQVAYAVFFTITLVAMLGLSRLWGLSSLDFIGILVNIAALLISVYEANRTLRELP